MVETLIYHVPIAVLFTAALNLPMSLLVSFSLRLQAVDLGDFPTY